MAQSIPWAGTAEEHGLPVRALRIALILGALVDLSGGIPLLLFPDATAAWLGESVRLKHEFWPMYASVFLFVLPCFYLMGAADPARNIVIVLGAIVGRLAGTAFYVWCLFGVKQHVIFMTLAAVNLLFALYYAGALGPAGRNLIRAALRPSR